MVRKLAAFALGLGCSGLLVPLFGDDASKRPVETTHTETVSLAPGGLIRVLDSSGQFSIEGWDRPEVEVTVTKSRGGYYDPSRVEAAARALEAIAVSVKSQSASEAIIATSLPRKRFASVRRGEWDVNLEYRVRAPRDARLVIHHRSGDVLVTDMEGDIEASSRSGDIVLMLPAAGSYSIDARSKLGTVFSDFPGSSHGRYLVGSAFVRTAQPPGRHITVRTGVGGISIKSVR